MTEFRPDTTEFKGAWQRAALALAVLALVVYAVVIARHLNACAGGSDTSGYLNEARLIASGKVHVPPRALAGLPATQMPLFLYAPLGLKLNPAQTELVPTYPPGLPLLLAAASLAAGMTAGANFLVWAHALLGVLITYFLGRAMRLPATWAVLGAAIIAVSPVYLMFAQLAMSDVPSLVWVTAAVLAAWKSNPNVRILPGGTTSVSSGSTQRHRLYPLASGCFFSLAVLLRPSNALAFIPIAIALGSAPQRWLRFVLGGLPAAIFFCLFNHAAYGSALTTGYGEVGSLFSAGDIPRSLLAYAHWLPILFTPVIFCFLGLPWVDRADRRLAAVLGTWVLGYAAFYSTYDYTHQVWWYMRFLLPAAPALVTGGLLVARKIARPCLQNWRVPAFIAVFILIVANGAWWSRFRSLHVMITGSGEATYPLTMTWLKSHIPPDAVVGVMQLSGAAFYYTDFTLVRWDEFDPESFRRVVAAAEAAQRPIYAAMYSYENTASRVLEDHMPGNWTQVGAVRDVLIWRRDGNKAPDSK